MAVHERVLLGRPPARPRPAAAVPAGRRWPAPLDAVRAGHAFVGRSAEAAALEATWRAAAGGRRRLAVLGGDAGIGKTRLAAELAALAHEDGAVVLFGRFEEEASAPYQPVVQMLRGWAGGASLAPFAERLGPRAAELGLVLPELGAAGAGGATPLHGPETGAQRLRLFDGIAALLAEIAGDAPLLVVLDDLHWADLPTLQLLGHLVRAPAPEAALFLATARRDEGSEALAALLAGLRREGTLERIELGGLDAGETAALVAVLDGAAATPAFVAELHEETEGNPFFIEEVLRHLAGAGDVALADAGVPDGVREVTGRRLARLGEPALAMLAVAAVIGREADFDVLDEAGPLHGDALVEALEEAVAAGVLREDPERVGRYAFSHALLRATLYDGLSGLRRARLHSRVGEALIARRGAQLDPHLGQLAHHFALAAPVDRPERAVDFALAAGRRADRLLAWEEAAGHYRAALRRPRAGGRRRGPDALRAAARPRRVAGARRGAATPRRPSRRPPRPPGRSATPGCSAAPRSATRAAGRSSAASRRTSPRCSRTRSPGSATRRSRCARGCSPGSRSSSTTRATPSAGSRSPTRRSSSPAGSAIPRRSPSAWTRATTRCGGRRPSTSGSRWRPSCAGSPRRSETRSWSWRARAGPWSTCSSSATSQGADIQIAAASRLAAALHRPLYEWWTSQFRCARAQIDGRFDEAERLAEETLAIGRRGQAENATARLRAVDVQRPPRAGAPRRGRGGRARDDRALPRGARVALLARAPAARARARGGGRGGVRDGRGGRLRHAPARRELADRDHAAGRGLRPAGRRRARRRAVRRAGAVRRAATCSWAAARPATARRRATWARSPRRSATGRARRTTSPPRSRMHEAMGARPFVARTQLAWAEMELARGDAGAARGRLAEAIVIADALGMRAVAERARRSLPCRLAEGSNCGH